ncbi:hypothetical protein BDY24DRAFT_442405 [Mrakia frigida]|uniref:uncharacterized protein n=1 Tax=Mrakia frigida TaxID=29902 RepID=UPI003FCBF450
MSRLASGSRIHAARGPSIVWSQSLRLLSISSPRPSPSPSPSPSRPPPSLSAIYATDPPSSLSHEHLQTFQGGPEILWHNSILDEQARLRRIDQLRIKLAPPGSSRSRVSVSRGRIVTEKEGLAEGEAVWVEEGEKMAVWLDLPSLAEEEGGEEEESPSPSSPSSHPSSLLLTPTTTTTTSSSSTSLPPWTPNLSLSRHRPPPPHDPSDPTSTLYNPRSTHSPFLPSSPSSPAYPVLPLLTGTDYDHLPFPPRPFPSLDLKFLNTMLDPNARSAYEPTSSTLDLSVPPAGRGAQPVLREKRDEKREEEGRREVVVGHPKRRELGKEGWEVVERLARRFLVEEEKEESGKREVEERMDLGTWVEEVKRIQREEREKGWSESESDSGRRVGPFDASTLSPTRFPPQPLPTYPFNPSLLNSLKRSTSSSQTSALSDPSSSPKRVPPTFTYFIEHPLAQDFLPPPPSQPAPYKPKPALSQSRSPPKQASRKPNPPRALKPEEPFASFGPNLVLPPTSSTSSTTEVTSAGCTLESVSLLPTAGPTFKSKPNPKKRKLDASSSSSSSSSSTTLKPIPSPTPSLKAASLHPPTQPKSKSKSKPKPKPSPAQQKKLVASPSSSSTPQPQPQLQPTPTPISTPSQLEEAASTYLALLLPPPSLSSSSSSSSDDSKATKLEDLVRSKLSVTNPPRLSSNGSPPHNHSKDRRKTSSPMAVDPARVVPPRPESPSPSTLLLSALETTSLAPTPTLKPKTTTKPHPPHNSAPAHPKKRPTLSSVGKAGRRGGTNDASTR